LVVVVLEFLEEGDGIEFEKLGILVDVLVAREVEDFKFVVESFEVGNDSLLSMILLKQVVSKTQHIQFG
jgi:hypothetical protein